MTGLEFVAAVEAALKLANTLPADEYRQGEWANLSDGSQIQENYCGNAATVILGVSPEEARRYRDGPDGARSRMYFALLRDGRFAVLVETGEVFNLSDVVAFDFVGGRKAVYEKGFKLADYKPGNN